MSSGTSPSLIKLVTQLYGNKRIWITEYGYETNPPDTLFGVPWDDAGALPDPGLRDRPRQSPDRHDAVVPAPGRHEHERLAVGVETAAGKKKPSFAAFEKLLR